jgi:hypothetical protein
MTETARIASPRQKVGCRRLQRGTILVCYPPVPLQGQDAVRALAPRQHDEHWEIVVAFETRIPERAGLIMLEHVNRIAEMTAYTVVTGPDGPGHHNLTKSGTLPDLHMKSDASALYDVSTQPSKAFRSSDVN